MDRILIIDTETTGLLDFKLPADDPSQPRICEVGCLLIGFDPIDGEPGEHGFVIHDRFEALIKPDGWTIPADASAINGITTEMCEADGIAMVEALRRIDELTDASTLIAGFSISYDQKMLRGEYRRHGMDDRYGAVPVCDVMRCCARLTGGRWPKLEAAVDQLLGEKHQGHRAMVDAMATARLFKLLRERDLVVTKQHVSTRTAPEAA
jgi:DNA polymerase III epsilon subunit-like protein